MEQIKREKYSALAAMLLGLAAVLCLALTVCHSRAAQPWVCWQSRIETVELGGAEREQVVLAGRQLKVMRGRQVLFVSDAGCKVSDFLLTDLDGDGAQELLLLVWKCGSYGPSRPFWVAENDSEYAQHIFIYTHQADGYYPLWMSSAIRPQVKDWKALPDGELSLLAPGSTDDWARWGWRKWGLERLDEPFEVL